ncbi:class I SAM-dependent methyltransferase [Mycobacterium deserti]|uniref:Class I SAM-dependent methyltransferase n=1 Tax=Mycobacterium deserti TaxID=2978347 RepID=A0ABT2ME08_9MYCO|nr:class I SAM-dependent methyltransferase [Mycobacterium deserti]MCT7660514.1 class I SAM-dependent methyltransferase [Mycobacterium deserti]
MTADGEYWNHNAAYHGWLVGIAMRHHGDVLDAGCGEGLLAQRLAAVSRSVTAIDPDRWATEKATERLATLDHVSVSHETFDDFDAEGRRFDLVTFVATLHHMDLRASLQKSRDLLTPGGEIAVVGVSANKTVRDWAWAVACVPAARLGSWWHREIRDVGVRVAEPTEGLDDIRRTVDDVLPGAWIRRGLYYRYRMLWSNGRVP